MILDAFEIDDDTVAEIVVRALTRIMEYHQTDPEPDSGELVAACEKLITYHGVPT